jgi:hypothetical protein
MSNVSAFPKSELQAQIRRPKEDRNPKTEQTRIDSDFGLRPSLGFRPSDFGLCETGGKSLVTQPRPRHWEHLVNMNDRIFGAHVL